MQSLTKLIDDFNNTIDAWIAELDRFDFEKLIAKPDANSWSLGQVYMHLINETHYYIEQMEVSINNNENLAMEMTDAGKSMFADNAFPEIKIKGDPASTDKIQQPQNKKDLEDNMRALKQRMNHVAQALANAATAGKTQHPGLGYFSGMEWLQFADLHLRHHLKQKERIKNFLVNQL